MPHASNTISNSVSASAVITSHNLLLLFHCHFDFQMTSATFLFTLLLCFSIMLAQGFQLEENVERVSFQRPVPKTTHIRVLCWVAGTVRGPK